MKPVGFHAIRHGVASELINSGTPITAVRDQMRHSDVRVTLGIYGHVIGNAQRKAVEGLSRFVGASREGEDDMKLDYSDYSFGIAQGCCKVSQAVLTATPKRT